MDAAQAMERAHRARLQARSPERAKLAEAINKLREAEAHAKAVATARGENFEARVAARACAEGGESAVAAAMRAAADHAVAKAKGTAGDPPRSVKEVRADIQSATDELAALVEADAVLGREAEAARNRVQYAETDRDRAVELAVRSDPATKELFAKFEKAHAEYENARRVMRLIAPMLDREHYHRADTLWSESWGDLPAVRIWAKAIESLRENADAPLPANLPLG